MCECVFYSVLCEWEGGGRVSKRYEGDRERGGEGVGKTNGGGDEREGECRRNAYLWMGQI